MERGACVFSSTHPNNAETLALAMAMQEKYDATVRAADVMQMSSAEFYDLMELVLMEFPIRMVHVTLPEWISALELQHWLVQRIMEPVYAASEQLSRMRDYGKLTESLSGIEGFESRRAACFIRCLARPAVMKFGTTRI